MKTPRCLPCEGLTKTLTKSELKVKLDSLKDWKIKDKALVKEYKFKNFRESIEFVNALGKMAEKQGHHPDIKFGWGYANIKWYTHSLKGISNNDLICAKNTDIIHSSL